MGLTARVLGCLAAGLLFVYLLAWAFGDRDNEHELPVPPPGYEYCTNGTDIGFCVRETP